MTLVQATENIGKRVVFTSEGVDEMGTIASVTEDGWVLVSYPYNPSSPVQADPDDLWLP